MAKSIESLCNHCILAALNPLLALCAALLILKKAAAGAFRRRQSLFCCGRTMERRGKCGVRARAENGKFGEFLPGSARFDCQMGKDMVK